MSNTSLKAIIEGFIFASDKAMSVDRVISFFPENEQPEKEEVLAAIEELQKDYDERGIELQKVSTGYRFQVRQELTPWVSRLWEEKPARYTRALLETLALIVYRQPITRGEIEEIRGVAVSSNIIKTLQEREWVRVVGHRDVPGRPALYATTKDFLDYFNLESLDQLPPLSEIKDLDTIATELDPEKNAALIEAINEMKEAEAAENAEAQMAETNSVEEGAQQEQVEDAQLSDEEPQLSEESLQDAENEMHDSAEELIDVSSENDSPDVQLSSEELHISEELQDAESEIHNSAEHDAREVQSESDYQEDDTEIVDEEHTPG